jgi:hypothetical protein
MHTHLVTEVGLLAARMILWVALLVGLLPRLLFGARRARLPHHQAQFAAGLLMAAVPLLVLGWLDAGAVALGAALAVAAFGKPFGRRAGLEVARQIWLRSVGLVGRLWPTAAPRGQGSSGVAPVLSVTAAEGRASFDRLSVRVRAAPAPMGALAGAAAAGIALACWRATTSICLTEAQGVRLLQRAGAVSLGGAWLPELAFERLFEALAGGAPAAASVALAAPLVLVSAVFGMRLLPRFAPEAPTWIGAVAGALVLVCALLEGHDASPRLLVSPLLPWACAVGGAAAWRSGRAFWVPVALAPLHPHGGVLAFTGALLALSFDRRPRIDRALLVRAAAAIALAALLAALGGFSSPRELAAAPAGAGEVGAATIAVGAAASLWLLFGAARAAPQARAARRALGVLLALVLVISSGIGGPLAAALPPHAALALTVQGTAVGAADLARRSRWLYGALVVAAGALASSVLAPAPPGGLSCDVLELASALRSQRLPYTYVVASAPESRAAFEGKTFWIDAPASGELLASGEAIERTLADGHAVFLLAPDSAAPDAVPWLPPGHEPVVVGSSGGSVLYRLHRAAGAAAAASPERSP